MGTALIDQDPTRRTGRASGSAGISPLVERVAQRVLNQLAGVDAIPSGIQRSDVGQCVLVCIGMHGAVKGIALVAAPLDLCSEIAGGVLGSVDAGTANAECAMGEIASVIAACTATDLEPLECTWMTPPAVSQPQWEDWSVIRDSLDTLCLEILGRPMLVSVDVRLASPE